jgi:hypothetical protein
MAYIVQADDCGNDAISMTLSDRKEALAAAIQWQSDG